MKIYRNVPATPMPFLGAMRAGSNLSSRTGQIKPAKEGLSKSYTIDDKTDTAHNLMYGKYEKSIFSKPSSFIDKLYKAIIAFSNEGKGEDTEQYKFIEFFDKILAKKNEGDDISDEDLGKILEYLEKENPGLFIDDRVLNNGFGSNVVGEELDTDRGGDSLTELSLDKPEQWTMGWTTYANVDKDGQEMESTWISTLTNADEATKQFWPTIATYGLVYNLLVLQKVGESEHVQFKNTFNFDDQLDKEFVDKLDALQKAGNLYVIDFSIFKELEFNRDSHRFTPSTITLLAQDAESKAITPLAIRVAGYQDANAQVYQRENATDSAWLYALQAAKTSVTVYGIWLGHVYHWHIVSGAMQMTMESTLKWDSEPQHQLYQLLSPQSKHLIGFDALLFALWGDLAPPTSINSGNEFLKLCNVFAEDRGFFDDDPLATLERLGLNKADFSKKESWDLYSIVPYYLDIWNATADYVEVFVDHSYEDDNKVLHHKGLQDWMTQSKNPTVGKIRGLPEKMDSREALKKVLTSLLYRITMHGASRLNSNALPAFTFLSNFPPCLQTSKIPRPDQSFDTKELLRYLPKTGIIGGMLNFYFLFVFSKPYEPFIPLDDIEENLFFGDGTRSDQRNEALVTYRTQIKDVIERIQKGKTAQIHQWPLSIET